MDAERNNEAEKKTTQAYAGRRIIAERNAHHIDFRGTNFILNF